MKRQRTDRRPVLALWILLAAVLLIAAFGYLGRGYLRGAWASVTTPKLPAAQPYQPRQTSSDTIITPPAPSPFEGGSASSQHYVMEVSPVAAPPSSNPLAFTGILPSGVNLDVPFTSQAPYSDWSEPYQNACEEVSAMMVSSFYQGKTGKIPLAEADAAIKKLVAYEDVTFGDYKDTTAEQTAQLLRNYFGFKTVLVKPLGSTEELKQILALGYPIIIPFDGKLLGNPNFRNGGPAYHMLVLRGYTADRFITNDPGTRLGKEYTYPFATIQNAAHDWTGDEATVATGRRVMMIVLPNPSQ